MLIQKKIIGIELDLSALFMQGRVIHFNYAEFKAVHLNKFGPSILRKYRQISQVDPSIETELSEMGEALGIHGFSNISCIEAQDGSGRYYFEVDLRPNAWFSYTSFLGDPPYKKIKKWFSEKKIIPANETFSSHHPLDLTIPYFLRLTPKCIFKNHYQVWKFIPPGGFRMLLSYLWSFLKAKVALKKRIIFFSKHFRSIVSFIRFLKRFLPMENI